MVRRRSCRSGPFRLAAQDPQNLGRENGRAPVFGRRLRMPYDLPSHRSTTLEIQLLACACVRARESRTENPVDP